jgi:hypothetical protein
VTEIPLKPSISVNVPTGLTVVEKSRQSKYMRLAEQVSDVARRSGLVPVGSVPDFVVIAAYMHRADLRGTSFSAMMQRAKKHYADSLNGKGEQHLRIRTLEQDIENFVPDMTQFVEEPPPAPEPTPEPAPEPTHRVALERTLQDIIERNNATTREIEASRYERRPIMRPVPPPSPVPFEEFVRMYTAYRTNRDFMSRMTTNALVERYEAYKRGSLHSFMRWMEQTYAVAFDAGWTSRRQRVAEEVNVVPPGWT